MSAGCIMGAPVWTHHKPGGDLIAAAVREWRGFRFLNIRLWTSGGTTPTKKGATIPLEAVPGLAQALTAHAAEIAAGALVQNTWQ